MKLSVMGLTITIESECRKVRYGHKDTAQAACYAMAQKGSVGLEPYFCEYCDSWHIGHSRDDPRLT